MINPQPPNPAKQLQVLLNPRTALLLYCYCTTTVLLLYYDCTAGLLLYYYCTATVPRLSHHRTATVLPQYCCCITTVLPCYYTTVPLYCCATTVLLLTICTSFSRAYLPAQSPYPPLQPPPTTRLQTTSHPKPPKILLS